MLTLEVLTKLVIKNKQCILEIIIIISLSCMLDLGGTIILFLTYFFDTNWNLYGLIDTV